MKITLTKKPMKPTIIEGFPGFGLIGTITTEFLIEALKAKPIGIVKIDDLPAMIAIHNGKIVKPIEIFHDEKTNIMIFHVVTNVQGFEWAIADAIIDIAKQLDAKELISLEGVASPGAIEQDMMQCFFYSNKEENKKKFKNIGVEELKEGIIVGVTGALLAEADKAALSCVFAETESQMPDSKAAAKIIEVLDKYLGLKLDPAPLLEQAEKFESKLKGLMEQAKATTEEQKKKRLSYVG